MLLVQVSGGSRLWIGVHSIKTVRQTPNGGSLFHFVDDTSLTIDEESGNLVGRINAKLADPNKP